MKRKKPIGEDFVQTRTEEVSSAIIEKEVELLSPQFQSCFELDAWLELTGLSISFIILGLRRQLIMFTPQSQQRK